MPNHDQVETVVKSHFELWNAGDKSQWTRIWHPDLIMLDPVGGPEKHGSPAIENTWDRAFQPGHRWNLEVVFMTICENQAAAHVVSHANLDGKVFDLESIELYWVGDDGRIARCHTYFTAKAGQNLDPYWTTPNT